MEDLCRNATHNLSQSCLQAIAPAPGHSARQFFNDASDDTPYRVYCTGVRPSPASNQAAPGGSAPACLPHPALSQLHLERRPAELPLRPKLQAMPVQAQASLWRAPSSAGLLLSW